MRYSDAELLKLSKVAVAQARRFGFCSSDAEDVSQLVLIDLITTHHEVRQPVSWVKKVALRKAWRLREKRKSCLDGVQSSIEPSESPDLSVRIDLNRHFSQLPREDTRLWLRRCIERHSLKELLEGEGESESTIKRRLSRTTERLQRRLGA